MNHGQVLRSALSRCMDAGRLHWLVSVRSAPPPVVQASNGSGGVCMIWNTTAALVLSRDTSLCAADDGPAKFLA
jgi:hypothetical protein